MLINPPMAPPPVPVDPDIWDCHWRRTTNHQQDCKRYKDQRAGPTLSIISIRRNKPDARKEIARGSVHVNHTLNVAHQVRLTHDLCISCEADIISIKFDYSVKSKDDSRFPAALTTSCCPPPLVVFPPELLNNCRPPNAQS